MRTFEAGKRYGEHAVVFEIVKRTAKTITYAAVQHAGRYNERKEEPKTVKVRNWVGRYKAIYNNIIPELMAEFKANRIVVSVIYEASGLPEDYQKQAAEVFRENEVLTLSDIKQLKKNWEASQQIPGQMDISQIEEKQEAAGATESDTGNETTGQQEETATERAGEATEGTEDATGQQSEYVDPQPEQITSLCYSCTHYEDCHDKTATVTSCNAYENRREARKTDEERYNEEQAAIDQETQKKLREMQQEACRKIMESDAEDKEEQLKEYGCRMKFPAKSGNLMTRWCSPYLKIDVAATVLRNLETVKENSKVLICSGERRGESKGRSKYNEMEIYFRANAEKKLKRTVHQWRPVIDYSEKDVWEVLKRNRVNPHPCYRAGWNRCSCAGCIFSTPELFAGFKELYPAEFEEMKHDEKALGFTLDNKCDLETYIEGAKPCLYKGDKEAIHSLITGIFTESDIFIDGVWKYPAGAFHGAEGGPC